MARPAGGTSASAAPPARTGRRSTPQSGDRSSTTMLTTVDRSRASPSMPSANASVLRMKSVIGALSASTLGRWQWRRSRRTSHAGCPDDTRSPGRPDSGLRLVTARHAPHARRPPRGCRRARRRRVPGRRRRRPPGVRGCRRGRSGRPGRGSARAAQTRWTTPGRSSARTSRTVARAEASGRTTTMGAIPPGSGPPARRRIEPTGDDRVEPLPQDPRVQVLLGHVPHRDAHVALRPRARRADRGTLRGEHRGGVGEEPDPVRCQDGHPNPALDGRHRDRRHHRGVPPEGSTPPPAGPAATDGLTQHRLGPGRQGPHEPGSPGGPRLRCGRPGVRLGEREQQVERLGVTERRRDHVGGCGILRVSGRRGLRQQQMVTHQPADEVRRALVVAHPGRHGRRDRLAGRAVLGQATLADVVQQARRSAARRVGRRPGSGGQPRGRSPPRAGRR